MQIILQVFVMTCQLAERPSQIPLCQLAERPSQIPLILNNTPNISNFMLKLACFHSQKYLINEISR